jgi:hypothetical protein
MKRPRLFAVAILLLFGFIRPYKSYAGFPIGKYRDIVVPSFNYYTQTNHYDVYGDYVKGAPGARYSSFSTNLYVGYGISRRLDLIVTAPFLYQVNTISPGKTVLSQGAGDALAGLSYNVVNFSYVRFLSVQVSGIAPLYTAVNGASALGLGDYGTEVKLMFCGAFPSFIADKGYFNTEVAYRRYFNTQGPDQFSFLATVGFPVSWHNQVSFDISVMRSFSDDRSFNINYNAERDYAYVKPQLNLGHTFTRRFSMFVGGYYVPYGINTGLGYGGSVVAIIKL